VGNSKADNDIAIEIVGARAAVFDALVRVSQLQVADAVGSVVATAINSLGSMSGAIRAMNKYAESMHGDDDMIEDQAEFDEKMADYREDISYHAELLVDSLMAPPTDHPDSRPTNRPWRILDSQTGESTLVRSTTGEQARGEHLEDVGSRLLIWQEPEK